MAGRQSPGEITNSLPGGSTVTVATAQDALAGPTARVWDVPFVNYSNDDSGSLALANLWRLRAMQTKDREVGLW
jgi:hypothetical protein